MSATLSCLLHELLLHLRCGYESGQIINSNDLSVKLCMRLGTIRNFPYRCYKNSKNILI